MPPRVLPGALLLIGVACSRTDTASLQAERRTLSLLDNHRLQHPRAGVLPARVRGGEIAIIDAARISPDGRSIVLFDKAPPYIKIVNDSGVVSAIIQLRGNAAGEAVERPVLAISNQTVMLARQDLRRLELYNLEGKAVATITDLNFAPITATAVNDSVWFLYGPSDAGTGRENTWAHCLYFRSNAAAPFKWRDAFRDSVSRVGNMDINAAAPYVKDGTVTIEHRQRWGSVVLSVNCGDGTSDPVSSIRAYGPRAARALPAYVQASAAPYLETDQFGAAGLTTVNGSLWTVSTNSSTILVFQRLAPNAPSTPPITVDMRGNYVVLDSRDGPGLLFGNASEVPMLFLVPPGALDSTLGVAPRRVSSIRQDKP